MREMSEPFIKIKLNKRFNRQNSENRQEFCPAQTYKRQTAKELALELV